MIHFRGPKNENESPRMSLVDPIRHPCFNRRVDIIDIYHNVNWFLSVDIVFLVEKRSMGKGIFELTLNMKTITV